MLRTEGSASHVLLSEPASFGMAALQAKEGRLLQLSFGIEWERFLPPTTGVDGVAGL